MFDSSISDILAILKGAFAHQIVNNRLNPIHLAIATTGYRIQSQTLRIPDRMGLFSPNPPRLQVHEASEFVLLATCVCFSIVSSGFIALLVRLCGAPNSLLLGAGFLSMTVVEVVGVWMVNCYSHRRAPGYDWGEWKLRKD